MAKQSKPSPFVPELVFHDNITSILKDFRDGKDIYAFSLLYSNGTCYYFETTTKADQPTIKAHLESTHTSNGTHAEKHQFLNDSVAFTLTRGRDALDKHYKELWDEWKDKGQTGILIANCIPLESLDLLKQWYNKAVMLQEIALGEQPNEIIHGHRDKLNETVNSLLATRLESLKSFSYLSKKKGYDTNHIEVIFTAFKNWLSKSSTEIDASDDVGIISYPDESATNRIAFLYELGILTFLQDKWKDKLATSPHLLGEAVSYITGINASTAKRTVSAMLSKDTSSKAHPALTTISEVKALISKKFT